MAFTVLSIADMIAVTESWLDPEQQRPTLESIPELSGNLMMLDRAHEQLVASRAHRGTHAERYEELTERLEELDDVHDRMAKALYNGLEVLSLIEGDSVTGQTYMSVRELLFPDGLSINAASWRSESVNAAVVSESIDDEVTGILETAMLGRTSCADIAERWLDSADSLGDVLGERADIVTESDKVDDETDGDLVPADERKARIFWVRAVNSFVSMLELVALDEGARDDLLATLHDAEIEAMRRRAEVAD